MRLLVYNIAYGTGSPGGEARRLLTVHRYLRTSELHFRQIMDLLYDLRPDVAGIIEADSGSFRTAGVSHPDAIEQALRGGWEKQGRFDPKYGPKSPLSRLPLLRNQTNALLGQQDAEVKKHYLPNGTKRLVLEREAQGISVFLVHLGLTRRTRIKQLAYLKSIIPTDRPVVLAGDFNTFQGEKELSDFLTATKLRNANPHSLPTYPAWKPLKQLDYILVSPQLEVKHFEVLPVPFSDHLPLLADIRLLQSTDTQHRGT